jgi:2'-5' RNA ligase
MSGDYRVFVGAYPEGEIAAHIQALRERLDPTTARITPPHVTLVGAYWRNGPPLPENERPLIVRLQALDGKIPALRLLLGGIHTFPPAERPVIYLGMDLTPELQAARVALLQIAGADTHTKFVPHLTLAMRLPAGQARRALEELQQSEWHTSRHVAVIDELRLILIAQRGPEDPAWSCIARIKCADATRREDRPL